MRKNILFIATIALLALASCGKKAEMARDFASAVNQKDTLKLNSALQPRKAAWDVATFANINLDGIEVEEIGENKYKAVINDTTYFVLTALEEQGYKVDTVKNIFTLDRALLDSVRRSGILPAQFDDIDAMAAVHKLKTSMASEANAKAEQAAKDALIEKRIRELYTKVVFDGYADIERVAGKFFTPKMMKKLAAAYEYEDGGYAVWELRTDAQDGTGPSRVTSVTPLGDGWYLVKFLDMGFNGTKKLKAVEKNGTVLFDDYK